MNNIIIGLLFLWGVCGLQLLLRDDKTCLNFNVENDNDKMLFTYHHNANLNTANLVIYDESGIVMAESGDGPDYKNFL